METQAQAVHRIFRGDIGAAWARAEERLGEYWRIRTLAEIPKGWEAVATDGNRIRIGHGPTPAAALDDIAGA